MSQPILLRRSQNEALKCKAPGCSRYRLGVSGYCGRHNKKKVEYGATDGRRFYPRDFELEREKARQVIDLNREHDGIKNAVRFFSDWMKAASMGQPVLASKYL